MFGVLLDRIPKIIKSSSVMKKGLLKQNGVHLQDHEFDTVRLMLNNGIDIELIPPSKIKGFQMPDIMMQGIPWEMKSPQGNGKNTIRHTIQNAGHQSSNIIIDLRRCKLKDNLAINEIQLFFRQSNRIKRIKIITTDEKIIDFSS